VTDIVERLRDHADRLLFGGRNTDTRILCEEAAQEIERLRIVAHGRLSMPITPPTTEE